MKTQVKLAAELGSKIYRFNYNPVTEEDFAYLDTVLAEVLAYGMDMMLVLDDAQGTPEAIAQRIGATAARYTASSPHGFIRYLQVFGEADIPALLDSNPADVPDGSRPSHYSDAVTNDWYGLRVPDRSEKQGAAVGYHRAGLVRRYGGVFQGADSREGQFHPGYSHHRN